MKKTLLVTLTVLALLSILLLCPSEITYAEIVPIPLDQNKMEDVDPSFYLSDTEYQDPSLHITMERGEFYAYHEKSKKEKRTNYWVIRIEIADASQIRTALSNYDARALSNRGKETWKDSDWIKKVNPVLAINGDTFRNNFGKIGRHAVRQGTVYANSARNYNKGFGDFEGFDALIIDDAGDFHIIRSAKEPDFEAFEGNIVNCFSFGPAIMINGERVTDLTDHYYYSNMYGAYIPARRICICQTGPLSYAIVQSDGPDDPDKSGLTMVQFSELVSTVEGIQTAYCLDGGSSCRILFNGVSKDSPYPNTKSAKSRLSDILYFASAYQKD